jgi:8-oxo-dGTP pyrophosphatase MutT (NUDIX family)
MEHNETEQETALREIREETGLQVELTDIFRHCLSYSPKAGVYKEVVYFIAVKPRGTEKVQEEELSEIHWVSIHVARQLVTYDNDADLLEKAVKCLREHPEVLE